MTSIFNKTDESRERNQPAPFPYLPSSSPPRAPLGTSSGTPLGVPLPGNGAKSERGVWCRFVRGFNGDRPNRLLPCVLTQEIIQFPHYFTGQGDVPRGTASRLGALSLLRTQLTRARHWSTRPRVTNSVRNILASFQFWPQYYSAKSQTTHTYSYSYVVNISHLNHQVDRRGELVSVMLSGRGGRPPIARLVVHTYDTALKPYWQ